MKWAQGVHLAIIGATGTGKTYATREILKLRGYVISLVSKADALVWAGWKTVPTSERIDIRRGPKWRLYPNSAGNLATVTDAQRFEFWRVLEKVWAEGKWTINVDELYYTAKRLDLEAECITLITQGRSKGITFIGGIQRPAWVSRFFLSEASIVLAFRVGDGRDRKALAEAVNREWADSLEHLPQYTFSAFDKVTGEIAQGKASDIPAILGGGYVKRNSGLVVPNTVKVEEPKVSPGGFWKRN